MNAPPNPPPGTPPPPPAGTPPPPGPGAVGGPVPPPPFGRAGAGAAPASFSSKKSPEELKEERSANRAAMLSLAAKPEIIAIGIAFSLLWILLVDADILAALIGLAVFALFGGIYMSGGDSVIASLQLGAIGMLTAAFLGDTIEVETDSLWWVLPGLMVIACEGGATYNNYRRRQGEISARIARSAGQNLLAVTLMAIVLASVARELTQLEGQVQWPWFAAAIIVFALGFVAAMLVIRRSAAPADTRRFNPGRRMLPPPRL